MGQRRKVSNFPGGLGYCEKRWNSGVPKERRVHGKQAVLKKLEHGNKDHETVPAHCAKRGIEFMSAEFGRDSLGSLGKLRTKDNVMRVQFRTERSTLADQRILDVFLSEGVGS